MSETIISLEPELAHRLCQEIRDHQPIPIFTQCWGCTTFSKGDTSQMCGAVVSCNLVLARYNKLKAIGQL